MEALVHRNKEPIRPFLSAVRALFSERRVSTVIVVGASGQYFDVADRVIMLDEYVARDVTTEAKRIAMAMGSPLQQGRLTPTVRNLTDATFGNVTPRRIVAASLRRDPRDKAVAKGPRALRWGSDDVDLKMATLAEAAQCQAVGLCVEWLRDRCVRLLLCLFVNSVRVTLASRMACARLRRRWTAPASTP